MSLEEEMLALKDTIKDQLVEDTTEYFKNGIVTDAAKEFYGKVAKRMARNYFDLKTGDAERKVIARENIESLSLAIGSDVAEHALDLVENGVNIVGKIVTTICKTLIKLAIIAI